MDRVGTAILNCIYGVCLRHPKKVMALWSISALSCAYWALDLTNYCVLDDYIPPPGAPSEESYTEIGTYFPQMLSQDFEIVMIQTKDDGNVISDATEHILSVINDTLWTEINPHYHILLEFISFYDAA